MALRSIDQRYWTDPYVESLSATEKLVYIHLFSSAHTNLVGVFQASRRMIAFQTASPGPDVDAALERFRRDGKAIIDGGEVWLASYIRHQCTSSPKMVAAMRGQLAKVESDAIRKAIQKGGLKLENVQFLLGGDLLNQIITASFSARELGIPSIGLYGACSTMAESLCLGSMLLDGEHALHDNLFVKYLLTVPDHQLRGNGMKYKIGKHTSVECCYKRDRHVCSETFRRS